MAVSLFRLLGLSLLLVLSLGACNDTPMPAAPPALPTASGLPEAPETLDEEPIPPEEEVGTEDYPPPQPTLAPPEYPIPTPAPTTDPYADPNS